MNSIVHRCLNKHVVTDPTMLNIDTLVMILGRPNFHRSRKTGDWDDEKVSDPALLILNGYCHRFFKAQGHDQVISNSTWQGFTAGKIQYNGVVRTTWNRLSL